MSFVVNSLGVESYRFESMRKKPGRLTSCEPASWSVRLLFILFQQPAAYCCLMLAALNGHSLSGFYPNLKNMYLDRSSDTYILSGKTPGRVSSRRPRGDLLHAARTILVNTPHRPSAGWHEYNAYILSLKFSKLITRRTAFAKNSNKNI